MDDDERTIFCGNLSDKVTEDTLYELFLQGGPVEKVSIPKDRDGKQRAYGFVTYKHVNSIDYALQLFEGTILYDRLLSMKPRHNTESQQLERSLGQDQYMNHTRLQQNQQIAMRNLPMLINTSIMLDTISTPYYNQLDASSSKNDRNFRRMHPYQKDKNKSREKDRVRDRDRDKNRDRERSREYNHNDHYRDEKQYYNRDNNYRPDHSRYSGNRKRWSYH